MKKIFLFTLLVLFVLVGCAVGPQQSFENESEQNKGFENTGTTEENSSTSVSVIDSYPAYLKSFTPVIVEWGKVTDEHHIINDFSDFWLPNGEKTETGFTKVEAKIIQTYPFFSQLGYLDTDTLNKTDAFFIPDYFLNQISEGKQALLILYGADVCPEISRTVLVLPACGGVVDGVSYHYPNLYSISAEGEIRVPTFQNEIYNKLKKTYYFPFDEANERLLATNRFEDGMTLQDFETFLLRLSTYVKDLESKYGEYT